MRGSKWTIRIVAVVMAMVLVIGPCSFLSCFLSYASTPVDPEYDSYAEYADELLKDMSVSEKVAQMMLVAHPSGDAAEMQRKYQFGGYILFARDFASRTPSQFRSDINAYQENSDIEMLIAVDEEGGTVVRASYYSKYRSSRFQSPRQVYRTGGYSAITKDTRKKDKFLRSLGINTNLAPVADVAYSRGDFMYSRSFSTSASSAARFIKMAVKQMNRDNIVSTLKHFPGYGGNGDTHTGIIRDSRSMKTFRKRDLKPFRAGIDSGADMVMISHLVVKALDKKNPASLSPKVHRYLRKDLGFDGVIMIDGLGMRGIRNFVGGDDGEAAVRAVLAGTDLLCVTGKLKTVYYGLISAVEDGRISENRLDRSVRRILIMKMKRGIIKMPEEIRPGSETWLRYLLAFLHIHRKEN